MDDKLNTRKNKMSFGSKLIFGGIKLKAGRANLCLDLDESL
jgi:hypothetical protein